MPRNKYSAGDKLKVNRIKRYLGDKLPNRRIIEIERVTRVPFPVTIVKLKLHEVACDGGEQHLARLVPNGVVELKDFVVPGTSVSYSHATWLVLR